MTGPSGWIIDVTPLLRAAIAIAIEDRHAHVGSEHLALLALAGADGIDAMAREAGIDPAPLPTALRSCCNETAGAGDPEPRATPRTARMLAAAAQRAALDGAAEIGPIHLVATLLDELASVAWTGLNRSGITRGVLLDGIERRNGRQRGLIPSPTAAGAARLLHDLQNPVVGWLGFIQMQATAQNQTPAEAAADSATIAQFRALVTDYAQLAIRLGYLTFGEFGSLTGQDPRAAEVALHQASERWGLFRARRADPPAPTVARPEASSDIARGSIVLVVDDEPSARDLASRLLVRYGMVPETLPGGKLGIERRFRLPFPSMIVLNGRMPGVDGYSAAKEIRQREAALGLARVPILLDTGASLPPDWADPNFDGRIKRPWSGSQYIAAVREVGWGERPPTTPVAVARNTAVGHSDPPKINKLRRPPSAAPATFTYTGLVDWIATLVSSDAASAMASRALVRTGRRLDFCSVTEAAELRSDAATRARTIADLGQRLTVLAEIVDPGSDEDPRSIAFHDPAVARMMLERASAKKMLRDIDPAQFSGHDYASCVAAANRLLAACWLDIRGNAANRPVRRRRRRRGPRGAQSVEAGANASGSRVPTTR